MIVRCEGCGRVQILRGSNCWNCDGELRALTSIEKEIYSALWDSIPTGIPNDILMDEATTRMPPVETDKAKP